MMADGLVHFTETTTGTDPLPVCADQILSTIDCDALLPLASPEDEDEDGLTESNKTMNNNSSSCVLLERHRRKRITQSCSTLRQLLPTIPGGRVDMVMVLETTVTFLEMVQELVPVEDPKIKLCPPAELYADWLLQSQKSRGIGHKMAAKQEKKVTRRGDVLKMRTSRRHRDRQLPVSL